MRMNDFRNVNSCKSFVPRGILEMRETAIARRTPSGFEPAKSTLITVFVPNEALQGEEVPSFALWKGVEFDSIELQIPEGLELEEVYNVANGDWHLSGRRLVITKVEVNGYLGLLLESKHTEKASDTLELRFDFYSQDKTRTETRRIHIFRPLLAPVHVPRTIRVEGSKREVSTPIVLQNRGYGTVIVNVKTADDSESKLEESALVADFEKSFRSDVELGFARLKEQFPRHGELVGLVTEVMFDTPNLSEPKYLSRIEKVVDDLRKAATESSEFGKGVGDAVYGALLKNLHILSVFAQFAEYFHSVGTKKVIIRNPLDVVKVGPKPSRLHLKIEHTDLVYGYYPPIEIVSTLTSDTPYEVPIFKLITWEVSK